MSDTRKLDSDEIPLPAIAKKDGGATTLRCRTPGEAYLICEELEKEDILTVLPEEEELLEQFRCNGYVEVRVSSKAYELLANRRSTVEFQYQRLRADEPLPLVGKLLVIYLTLMIVPGVLVFIWLLTSYRNNGYVRKARDLKVSFLIGIVAWVLLVALFTAVR